MDLDAQVGLSQTFSTFFSKSCLAVLHSHSRRNLGSTTTRQRRCLPKKMFTFVRTQCFKRSWGNERKSKKKNEHVFCVMSRGPCLRSSAPRSRSPSRSAPPRPESTSRSGGFQGDRRCCFSCTLLSCKKGVRAKSK